MTLPELMVSLGLVSLLTLLLADVFQQGSRVAEMGGQRLDVQQSVREVVRRLGPLLESAVPPDGGTPALLSPDEGDTAMQLEFYSPTDHLGDVAINLRKPLYRLYRVRFDAPSLWLEQRDPASALPPRLLAARLRAVEFSVLDAGTVKVHVEAQAEGFDARHQARTFEEQLETVIHLPYFTTSP